MKKKMSDLSPEERMGTLDVLYTAASAITGRKAVKAFLKDLLTPSEKIMLGRRILIARLLLRGHSQARIGEKLKVGPNTIWKVERWLSDQMPGYEDAIEGLEVEMNKRQDLIDISKNPFSFKALKKKYPLHFLLFPSPKPKKREN